MLRLRGLATLIIIGLFAALVPGVAHADPGDVGVVGPSYSGAGTDPTGSKPESKLWWNDGSWWGSLFHPASSDFHIFRLDTATQTWTDTGVALDDRPKSRADVLWDGTHLYVASHIYTESPAAVTDAEASRLYRYSYSSSTRTYSRDSGFPVKINNYKTETLVIAKDTQGKLWATWTQGSRIYVNRTTVDDMTWGASFIPPVSGTTLAADDISSLVTVGGNKIGLMWSNQVDSAMYFAVHTDGTSDTTWEPSRTAIQGPKNADDHINLKSLQADTGGRVFAAVKTSQTTSSAPLNMLLVRDPGTGDWASYPFGTVAQDHTRPIVLIDDQAGVIHVFATGPTADVPGDHDVAIDEKKSPIDNISFASGYGTPVIRDFDVPDMNNATSTKQNVNATTGLVVLASNQTSGRYWHHYDPLGPGTPSSPTAGFSASPTSGPTPLPVTFTDTSTGSPTSWSWTFGDGAISTERNPVHTYTAPGTYTVSLTVRNAAGVTDTETKQSLITAGTQTLYPVADAYVTSKAPSKNYGRATTLRVRASGPTLVSYLKFDVSGLSGTVTSARLRLRVKDTGTDGGTVYPVANDTWTESGIIWSNRPAPGVSPLAGVGAVPTAGTWTNVDVTAAVTGAGAVGADGTVSLAVSGGTTNVVYYDSRESANDPQLIVTASSGPVAPAASFTASPTSGTAPLDVSFTDTSTGTPTTWAWNFGDTGTSTVQRPAHTYSAAGTYTVSLTVDYAGTPSTATQVITVLASAPPGTTSTFTAVADAYVKSDTTGGNYGLAPTVRVRATGPTVRSYLKFDVTGLSGTPTSARLRLRVAAGVGYDGGRVYAVADSGWTETGITWSNQPTLGAPGAIVGGAPAAGTWIELDVTGAISGNGTVTLALADGGANPVWYDSRETLNDPQLVIDS